MDITTAQALRRSLLAASYHYDKLARQTPTYRLLHGEYVRLAHRLLHSSIGVAKELQWAQHSQLIR